jgi:hypothetical protein
MTYEISFQPQYCVSDEVASIIRDSLEFSPYKMEAEGDELTKAIKRSTATSLKTLFSSMGRELSGENDCLALTLNGKFTQSTVDAIVFRILVEKQFVDQLSKCLHKDLIDCAFSGSLNTEYSQLSVVGNELVLFGTKACEIKEEPIWKKTVVLEPV